MRRPAFAAIAAALLLSPIACKRTRIELEQLPLDSVAVQTATMAIVHGTVGGADEAREGTTLLVDVRNDADRAVLVELEGDLLDAAGAARGKLNRDMLRIPAGGLRTFALVHHQAPVPDAVSADVRVLSVHVPREEPTVVIDDVHVFQSQDRAVIGGYAVNLVPDKEVVALVIASFYDDTGKLMKRPFALLRISGGAKHPARFVGPDGSRQAILFVGQTVY